MIQTTPLGAGVNPLATGTALLSSGHTLLVVHRITGWLLIITAIAFVLWPSDNSKKSDPKPAGRLLARAIGVVVAVVVIFIVVAGYGSPASAAVLPASDLDGSGLHNLSRMTLAVVFGVCVVGCTLMIAVARFAFGTAWAVMQEVARAALPALVVGAVVVLVLVAARG